MDQYRRNLRGAPFRDAFLFHRKTLGGDLWSSDCDCVLNSKFIVNGIIYDEVLAVLELKQKGKREDWFTYNEGINQNWHNGIIGNSGSRLLPCDVFIIEAQWNRRGIEDNNDILFDIDIYQFEYCDPRPDDKQKNVNTKKTLLKKGLTLKEYGIWEREYRQKRHRELTTKLKQNDISGRPLAVKTWTVFQEAQEALLKLCKEYTNGT